MRGRGISRRDFIALAGTALAAPTLSPSAFAKTPVETKHHGLSAFGDLKYGPDFEHLDYVNPDAPKGGTFNFQPPNWLYNQNTQTFNTLNSFVPKGDSPPRMELCFDSLMTVVLDEPDALYGVVAETVTLSPDRNSFEFTLRPDARFHDGTPLTAEDAAFSFNLFKSEGHPSLLLPLTHMKSATTPDPQTLRLTFSGEQSARTVLDVVAFPILSRRYFTDNPFSSSGLTTPLGSGPYRVGKIAAGRTIEFERVADYWARDLPINRGLHNFERIRIEFYRERQAAFEAFKKGDIQYRQEFTSRIWATGYDFPAVNAGKVVKREFAGEKRPSMQAVAVNQRRERFRDPRMRQAIAMCFDFEWTNRNLFYNAYERSQSCFERSDYKAIGMPSADELALLEPLRGAIPEDAFGEAVTQPVSDGSGRDRNILGNASRLLDKTGWKRSGAFRVNDRNERLSVELLIDDDAFARVFGPWTEIMRSIGIDASIRLVDAAQYQARQAIFDFDLISMALSFSATPTRDEIEGLFHSKAASLSGSRNLSGTSDPSVDALIDAVGQAEDRQSLITAMRSLDRVLRARRDWIPNWFSANHRVAFWDMFGYQEPKPDYGFPVEAMWWFDKDKAAAIGKG